MSDAETIPHPPMQNHLKLVDGLLTDDTLYRTLVQNVADYAIYFLSPTGIVTSWNLGAERAKGYRAEEIVGQHFSRFYEAADRAAKMPERALAIAREMGKFEDEGWRLRRDGSRLRAHVVIDPIYAESGTLLGFAKITRDISLQYEDRRSAEEQTRIFRLLSQAVTDHAIYMLDPNGHIANWNSGAERLKGYNAAEVVGRHFSIFHTEDDHNAGLPYRALARAVAHGKFEGEGWRVRRNGSRFWASITIDPIHDENRTLLGFAKITRDLTHQKQQVDEIRSAHGNLDLALAHMSQGLCLFDRHECLVICNDRFRELLNLDASSLQRGSTYTDLLWCLHANGAHKPEDVRTQIEEAKAKRHPVRSGGEGLHQEIILSGRTIAMTNRPLPDGGWVSTIDDVTERRKIEREVVHLAHHDTLTELPNRAAFQASLAATFQQREAGSRCALLYIDLDRFKKINDTFGHPAGDAVLRVVAERIRQNLRTRDSVARLGGDEFVVLCGDIRDDRDALTLADRLSRDLNRSMVLECGTLSISASIGVAISSDDDVNLDHLMHHADLAMYAAKDSGFGLCLRYEPGMREALQNRRALEKDLRQALEHEEFSLVFQPVVDTRQERVTSCEALLRWRHPERGNVPPLEFIPFAEEIGLMTAIDDWVIRTACRAATNWPENITISINLSPTRLRQPGLIEVIEEALSESGLMPDRLEIEITETSVISDLAGARRLLGTLRDMGVQIAMDDFGTGYSSLSLLREVPFTRIKIDRSFIHDMHESHEATAIVRAISGICESLGVHVTAEGVETTLQADCLRSEGCFEHQGYLISRPCTPAAVNEWIRGFNLASQEIS